MLLQDLKYAVRSLVLDRSVTVIVILCLALGIGINATSSAQSGICRLTPDA